MNETVNHVGRGHVDASTHEDGTETDVVHEVGVEVEKGLLFTLFWPIHCESDGLVNKSRVCIAKNSKNGMISIGSGLCTLSKLGILWEGAMLSENAANVVLPGGVLRGFING